MAGTPKRIGPVALTNTLTTNIYNQGSALIFDLIKQIHVVNKTGASVTMSMWLGATAGNAAGTEIFNAQPIPANFAMDFYFSGLKMLSTDFLVGGAGSNAALTVTILSEQSVV